MNPIIYIFCSGALGKECRWGGLYKFLVSNLSFVTQSFISPWITFPPDPLYLFQRFPLCFKLCNPYLFPSPVFDWSRKWMSWRKSRSSFSASSWSCLPSSIRWKQLCLPQRREWRLRDDTVKGLKRGTGGKKELSKPAINIIMIDFLF